MIKGITNNTATIQWKKRHKAPAEGLTQTRPYMTMPTSVTEKRIKSFIWFDYNRLGQYVLMKIDLKVLTCRGNHDIINLLHSHSSKKIKMPRKKRKKVSLSILNCKYATETNTASARVRLDLHLNTVNLRYIILVANQDGSVSVCTEWRLCAPIRFRIWLSARLQFRSGG